MIVSRLGQLAVLGLSTMLLASACRAQPQAEKHDSRGPLIIVTGRASLSVPADQVRISISVVSEGDEPREVIEENNRRVSRVLDALENAGVEDGEVSSGWFNIQPIYAPQTPQQRSEAPRISGYRVQNSVIVESTKIQQAGEFVQAAVDSGANRVDSVNFQLADDRAQRAEVLALAVDHARSDAQAVASAAGTRLGQIANIAIDSPMPIIPMAQNRRVEMMAAGGGAGAPPFVPGEIEVTASVTIEYEIEQ